MLQALGSRGNRDSPLRSLRHCFDPTAHVHLAGPGPVDDARGVGCDAFWHVGVGRDFGNESGHLAVFHTADADALLEARIDLAAVIARLMVVRIERVVLVDVDAAAAPELLPL